MKKSHLLLIICLVIACQRVPLTGRKQFIMVDSNELLALSAGQYREELNRSQVISSGSNYQMIQRVGNRLRVSMENYLNRNGYSDRIKGFQWEFNLIDKKDVNATCLPGGKVVFYTGILPYTQNESGIATVMGHEIAHAIAAHGAERLSEALLANGLMESGQILINAYSPEKKRQANLLLLQAVGIGYRYGLALPHSRAHESEADHLGLIFMAMAGYDPQQAVVFWQRMASDGGQKPPEFMSTHPSDERRVRDLQREMPEAMKYYVAPKPDPISLHHEDDSEQIMAADTNDIDIVQRVPKAKTKNRNRSKKPTTSAKNQQKKVSSQTLDKKRKQGTSTKKPK
ncbi:MAG: M48 family metalloprotease [Spirosoma sp.]|uniref:M48 family metallopeptidase n=1 Tax=Spirosoma sp. TaxID=1899569 RepID=UPI001AD1AEA5|nr:M48 family metalloprotease [Spirosoma sp.]